MEMFLKAKEILEAELKDKTQIGFYKTTNKNDIIDNLNQAFAVQLPEAVAKHGMSKIAILFEDNTQIMKVPCNGFYDDGYNENNEYYCEWKDFKNATRENPFDYCLSELNKYEKAVEYNVEMFFAKVSFYDNTENNYPLYAQEKVYFADEIEVPAATEESLNYIKDKKSNDIHWNTLSEEWLALAVDKYGKEAVENFIHFITRVEPEIVTDEIKYAYRADGSPVLFDFSGYREA